MDAQTLKKLQETELEILSVIDKICSDNDIVYSLYAGSAIGVVRHQGFIPWDDDIDIIMTRKNYIKFIDVWKKSGVKQYYLVSPETDEKCATSHMKVVKKGTILLPKGEYETIGDHGIWVDIFPLDKLTASNRKKLYRIGNEIIALTRVNMKRSTDTLAIRALRIIISLIPKRIRKKRLNKDLNWLAMNDRDITNEDYEWTELAATYTFKYHFKKELPLSVKRFPFEGKMFCLVTNFDDMLKQLYGDYMTLPPENERVCRHSPVKVQF